ncbi:hypothetical protein CJ030_MR2G024115 [Morella rubra]|uniref:Uncharacterized protein n=1 Tax=Morella rubra TaxID=262757 RepID=A0A6A1WEB2_9ROSI|nr:hypothetical protein CJ030_MR2G024115 [Morella rubra]
MSSFSRNFHIESKEFQVSIGQNGVIQFSEWSHKLVNLIHKGKFGAVWMVKMVDKLMEAPTDVDFASKFNDFGHSFLAQRCSNKGGRYVAVVEYGGRRKVGVVMVPGGRKKGYGWQILNRIFSDAVSFLRGSRVVQALGSSVVRPDLSIVKAVQSPVLEKGGSGRAASDSGIAGGVRIPEVNETSKLLHADGVANITSPTFNSINASKRHVSDDMIAAVSLGGELAPFNATYLWNHMVGLRKEVDRLEAFLIKFYLGSPTGSEL